MTSSFLVFRCAFDYLVVHVLRLTPSMRSRDQYCRSYETLLEMHDGNHKTVESKAISCPFRVLIPVDVDRRCSLALVVAAQLGARIGNISRL